MDVEKTSRRGKPQIVSSQSNPGAAPNDLNGETTAPVASASTAKEPNKRPRGRLPKTAQSPDVPATAAPPPPPKDAKDSKRKQTNGGGKFTNGVKSDEEDDDELADAPPPKKRGRIQKKTTLDVTAATAEQTTTAAATKKGNKSCANAPSTSDGGSAEEKLPKRKGKKPAVQVDKEVDDDEASTSVASTKTVIMKGKAPVDEACPIASTVHVYSDGEEVWDVTLNQTAIDRNNNKFYIIQLLESDNKKQYTVFLRWGRVGARGQHSLMDCGPDLEDAQRNFRDKFRDKTKNDWEDRGSFVKVKGKYDIVLRDYNATDEPDAKESAVVSKRAEEACELKIRESTLPERVQNLMRTIFNLQMMEEQVLEMNYDSKKAPLGRLTKAQVLAGYSSLKKIETLINGCGLANSADLVEACNEYYTRVPHVFGMRTPPVIRTMPQLVKEMNLLDTLGDIQIAVRTIQDANKVESPIDYHYLSLKIDIKPVDKLEETFTMVKNYLEYTKGPTHTEYQLELVDIFELEKEAPFVDVGNRMLLWHGSRLSNFVGILSQGLRIAPPEAPVTGYMFGKGVYFADVVTKSANYCFANANQNRGYMLLCDVALGKHVELYDAKYDADQLPPGAHSTKGVGEHAPDPSSFITWKDGVKVPVGKCMKLQLQRHATLAYNEYIVYDTKQIKLRYLVEVQFNYRRGRR